jgi:hypothetical protein
MFDLVADCSTSGNCREVLVMLTQDALDVLVAKVDGQAKLEGAALSSIELQMLRWSEVEPDGVRDQGLND